MKKIYIFILLCLSAAASMAQGDFPRNDTTTIILKETGKRINFIPGTQLYIDNDNLFHYGNDVLNNDDCSSLMFEVCPAAYSEFKRSVIHDKINTISALIFIGSIGYDLYELTRLTICLFKYDIESPQITKHGNAVLYSTGVSALSFFVGNIAMKKAKRHMAESIYLFNSNCAETPVSTPQVKLSFNVSVNSVGLSFNF